MFDVAVECETLQQRAHAIITDMLRLFLLIYSSIHIKKQKHNFTKEVQFERDKNNCVDEMTNTGP